MLFAFLISLAALTFVSALLWSANYLSYRHLKERTLRERRWDYNICCGETDGGGINADIVRCGEIPNFELVTDVNRLQHANGRFEHRVIFLTFRTRHDDRLPSFIAFTPARWLQSVRGQRNIAHSPGARLLKALGLG